MTKKISSVLKNSVLLVLTTTLFSFNFSEYARAQMEMKLRAPIRTWAGPETGICLCPYDQVVTSGFSLILPGKVYNCGETSSYSRSGGQSPGCYMGDFMYRPNAQTDAMKIETICLQAGPQICYVDMLNRL